MATQKPKIQGYVAQHCYDAFEVFRAEQSLSQSQALELLLQKALGLFTGHNEQAGGGLERKLNELAPTSR